MITSAGASIARTARSDSVVWFEATVAEWVTGHNVFSRLRIMRPTEDGAMRQLADEAAAGSGLGGGERTDTCFVALVATTIRSSNHLVGVGNRFHHLSEKFDQPFSILFVVGFLTVALDQIKRQLACDQTKEDFVDVFFATATVEEYL